MSLKQKKGLRSSIDDVLGDLLGDDDDGGDKGPVKVRSMTSSSVSSRPAAGLMSQSGKRSLLDDDFFSKLAEEAEKDDEGSEVSEADPAALLDSMKDIDDMDADLFGSKKKKKKPSSAPPQRKAANPGDNTKSREEMVTEEKKPSSAPASTARTYKKFSFLDNIDDSLDDLLDDLEDKQKMGKKTEPPSSSSPVVPQKTETASPAATVKKKDDLMFDDDGDDLMDALGFGESQKTHGNGATQKKDSLTDRPPRARTRLDELLGRGTSPRLLERPATGEKKDTKLTEKETEKPPEKNSAGKGSVMDEEDFTFGSYQPTMGSTPEGRQSRRQSVRFSTEDVSSHSPEHKPKPSARSTRPRSDWLGLKQEEEEEKMKEEPQKPPPAETLKPPASSSTYTQEDTHDSPRAESPAAPAPPKTNSKTLKDEEDDWLTGALSRKKTPSHAEDREHKQEVRKEVDVFHSSKPNVSPASRRRADESPIPVTEHRESTGSSIQHNTSTDRQHKPVFQSQKTTVDGAVPVTQTHTPLSADTLQQILIQQQLSQSHLWGLSGSERLRDTEHHGDTATLQKRIIQLEAQVRSLQLERDQNQLLLESVQQRHKQDTELMENMHRTRVKLLEESAAQREQRSRQENEDLAERLAVVTRLAEQERAELQAQHQRRLLQSQQDRDREVERLRELQRKSILEMKRDHEDQIQRLKKLKDEEIDAVTSATSQTRSLTAVIEQMERFSLRLGDLSTRVESSHENTTQGLEIGARQRDEQLRVLQDRLTQQQREMTEERSRLKEVIGRMDTQLAEQQRQLEKERWRVMAEQAKAESSLRGLEEERRTMMQHFSMEREELERAKSALLEEQQSVMQHCAEERRKLASEWSRLHTQEKQRQERVERETARALERDTHREDTIISLAQEQADLKLRTGELKQKEDSLQRDRDALDRDRLQLEREKEKLSSTALTLKTRAHETRLRNIHAQMERLRQQEHSLQQERLRMTDHHRDVERLKHTLPVSPLASTQPLITDLSPVLTSTHLSTALNPLPTELHARLAIIKHTAEKDRDFLQEEQYFLETLKKTSYNSNT
ncbi:fas-binding factor 1 isoform X16 [Danio rerio]|uniref:Fas-binding factor 1 isoform X16 n=3 Tax=Danio rerio TaxID=7955 RepID=A0AC58J0R4_DANRE